MKEKFKRWKKYFWKRRSWNMILHPSVDDAYEFKNFNFSLFWRILDLKLIQQYEKSTFDLRFAESQAIQVHGIVKGLKYASK